MSPTCGEGVHNRGISLCSRISRSWPHPSAGHPVTIARRTSMFCGSARSSPSTSLSMSPARAVATTNPCRPATGPTTRWTEERLLAFVRRHGPAQPGARSGATVRHLPAEWSTSHSSRRPRYQRPDPRRGRGAGHVLGGALDPHLASAMGRRPNAIDLLISTAITQGAPPEEDEGTTAGDHALSPDAGSDPEPGYARHGPARGPMLPDVPTRAMLSRLGLMVANCDEETADYLAAVSGTIAGTSISDSIRLTAEPPSSDAAEMAARSERTETLRLDTSISRPPRMRSPRPSGNASPASAASI